MEMTPATKPAAERPACPECGAPLQRLSGPEGYFMDRCMDIHGRATIHLVRRIDTVIACTGCEFAIGGRS